MMPENTMYRHMQRHRNYRDPPLPFITPPPAQDSSQHILNALNDKCIQHILSYLIGDIRDFLNAAEACKKFQENAKKCYPSIYMDFYMGFERNDHLPLWRVKPFLSIFGHLINTLDWDKNYENSYDSEIFNAIAEYCGQCLLQLRIYLHALDVSVVSQFKSLEGLTLVACTTFNNFKVPPMLQSFVVWNNVKFDDLDWMLQTHPNLNKIIINQLTELNDEVIIRFQASNPQLQTFFLRDLNITSSILQGIATRLPNLVDVKLEIQSGNNVEIDALHLSGLRNLKRLRGIPISSSLVDAWADNKVPIEDLQIVKQGDPQIVKSIARLITIQNLKLQYLSYEMVYNLVLKLPAIQELDITHCNGLSLNGLKRIIEQATNLKSLRIFDLNMLLDSDESINSILDLIRGRVKVEMLVGFYNISIPIHTYIYGPDNDWLKIPQPFM